MMKELGIFSGPARAERGTQSTSDPRLGNDQRHTGSRHQRSGRDPALNRRRGRAPYYRAQRTRLLHDEFTTTLHSRALQRLSFNNNSLADSLAAATGLSVVNQGTEGRGTLSMARYLEDFPPAYRMARLVP